jgi:hypothetical protein
MGNALLVHEEELSLNGQNCRIGIYYQGERRFFAMTRFSDNDAFICDGSSVEEVLEKQRVAIPLAMSCRTSFRKDKTKYALAA